MIQGSNLWWKRIFQAYQLVHCSGPQTGFYLHLCLLRPFLVPRQVVQAWVGLNPSSKLSSTLCLCRCWICSWLQVNPLQAWSGAHLGSCLHHETPFPFIIQTSRINRHELCWGSHWTLRTPLLKQEGGFGLTCTCRVFHLRISKALDRGRLRSTGRVLFLETRHCKVYLTAFNAALKAILGLEHLHFKNGGRNSLSSQI